MWKIARLPILFLIIFLLVGPTACSSSKTVRKPEQKPSSASKDLISSGPETVTKRLGEPTTIAKTPEGRILWIYEPSWKLLPNENGTVYVEFQNNKVTKVFKIK
jgi:hypothetical protein